MSVPKGLLRERGQGLVEFALALPIFMMLVVGILDFALIMWYRNSVALAAMEGTRYAIVRGAESGINVTEPMVESHVRGYVFAADPSRLMVNAIVPSTVRGEMVTVEVSYSYIPLTTLVLGGIPFTVNGKSVAQIVY